MAKLTSTKNDTNLKRNKINWAGGIGFIAATVAFFLIGFFVVGPLLQNGSLPLTEKTAATTPAEPEENLPSEDASSLPSVKVEITEKSPKPPTAVTERKPRETSQETPQEAKPELSVSVQPAPKPQEQSEPSQPKPQAQVQPSLQEPSLGTPTKLFYVRAGVFADRSNAESLSEKLSQSGFTSTISKMSTPEGERYAVQVGAFSDRSNADKLAESLRASGFSANVSASD